MNIGDYIIIASVLLLVILAVTSLRRNGSKCSCGCQLCSGCSSKTRQFLQKQLNRQ